MTSKHLLYSLFTLGLLAACTVNPTAAPFTPTVTIVAGTSTPTISNTTTPVPAMPSPSPTAPPISTPTPNETPLATSPVEPVETNTPTAISNNITDTFGIPMLLVPAGPFLMGSDVWNDNERPAHTVMLDAFYIDQFEVTNTSFAEFLNANGNQIEGYAHWVEADDPDLRIHQINGVWTPDEGYANHPINEATWYAARAYCQWRSDANRHVRLPSEAEWEKAARGDDGRTFPWGEQEPTCELANFAGCVYDSLPVDSHPAGVSPYGVYNMAGNVMEWVADWYAPRYDPDAYDNPTGPENGDYRIFRGGAWFNAPNQVRTTYRFAKLPVLTYMANGFRCASDVRP